MDSKAFWIDGVPVPKTTVAKALECAFQDGMRNWAKGTVSDSIDPEDREIIRETREIGLSSPGPWAVVRGRGTLDIETRTGFLVRLCDRQVVGGLRTLAQSNPTFFEILARGQELTGSQADLFLQFCLFGEYVFHTTHLPPPTPTPCSHG